MKVYRAALAWWYSSTALITEVDSNPVRHSSIGLEVRGIERYCASRDANSRAVVSKSDGVSMAMITQMSVGGMAGSDRELMCFAAAALATAGGLRPSELLGGLAPHLRDRALTVDQLVFYADSVGKVVVPVSSCMGSTFDVTSVNHCVVTLHVSKTNQLMQRQPIQIAAPVVVSALWRWRQVRGFDYRGGRSLFQLAGHSPLRTSSLVSHVQSTLRSLGHHGLALTGKCFRIGLASTLSGSGASPSDISTAGHWSTNGNTWARYADPHSHAQRAREVNRRLGSIMSVNGIDTCGASSVGLPSSSSMPVSAAAASPAPAASAPSSSRRSL